jgi:hypothetical protein
MIKYKKYELLLWIFVIIIFSYLSSNNFINNDNFFPVDYLFMLDYREFYDSFAAFFPGFFPEFLIKPILYLFVTPLSSTYAPLAYIFYPGLLLFDNAQYSLWYVLFINVLINIIIVSKVYSVLKNKHIHFFRLLMMLLVGSIGSLIYLGSNMPYAFIFSSTILIIALATDDDSSLKKDTIILLFLYLLNYQIIFLIPSYYLCKFLLFYDQKKWPDFKSLFPSICLLITVFASFVFFSKRGKVTGIHDKIGINWNSGINNEFIIENNNYFNQLIDYFYFLPRSIFYHFNEIFFDFKFISIIFWLLIIFIIFSMIIMRKVSKYYIFGLSSLFVFTVLAFLGKTSFGPTRHTLFLVPVTIALFYPLFIRAGKNIKFLLYVTLISLITVSTIHINSRNNNIPGQLIKLSQIVIDNYDSDILLLNCTYQPFIENTFREQITNRKVYYYCGSRFQLINSKLKSKGNLLVIDATGKNADELKTSINSRIKEDVYNKNDFKLISVLYESNYDMEQKDLTQRPRKTGLNVWKINNKITK